MWNSFKDARIIQYTQKLVSSTTFKKRRKNMHNLQSHIISQNSTPIYGKKNKGLKKSELKELCSIF